MTRILDHSAGRKYTTRLKSHVDTKRSLYFRTEVYPVTGDTTLCSLDLTVHTKTSIIAPQTEATIMTSDSLKQTTRHHQQSVSNPSILAQNTPSWELATIPILLEMPSGRSTIRLSSHTLDES